MESTLSLKYADLVGEVGLFLGYGRGEAFGDQKWTTSQKAAIDSCVKSGLRQFYFPPPLSQTGVSYDWSFLKPTVTASLASGLDAMALPDDFGGLEGEVTVLAAGSQVYAPVALTGEGMIRELYSADPTKTGRPERVAIRPLKGTSVGKGQRFDLFVFPTADQAYTLQFQYYILPDYLSDAFPHTYGGMAHAETILESCLSIAEQRLDDRATVHSMKFQERLAASISLDRRNKPQKLGYNRDLSDGMAYGDVRDQHWRSPITVNGVQY